MKTMASTLHVLLATGVALGSSGCSGADRPAGALSRWVADAPPARPVSCVDVLPGASVQDALDDADPGAALCLAPGRHAGPLVITKPVTLWGPREAVVKSGGVGTTLRVTAPGTSLLGFTVDGSGVRFDQTDAAVLVHADDARVEGLSVRGAVFGIMAERAHRVTIRGNEVAGLSTGPLGLRGDGIRLWETRDSVVDHNHVTGGRDLVVWYSPRNRVTGNLVENCRYGTHFMYSHGCHVEDNLYLRDVVGIFVMYSRDMTLARNVVAQASGAAGIGIGLKESGNVVATRNLLVKDTVGIYVDTSPQQAGDANRFEDNSIRLCGTGVVFHSSETKNAFVGNAFRDNLAQVRVQGGGNALGVLWDGNDFDTYQGYDLDGDGTGDVPYEMRSLSSSLVDAHPDLAFFHGSATLSLLDVVSHAFPLFAPDKVLVDARPRMAAREEAPGAH